MSNVNYIVHLSQKGGGKVVAKIVDGNTKYLVDHLPREVRTSILAMGFSELREGIFEKEDAAQDYESIEAAFKNAGFII